MPRRLRPEDGGAPLRCDSAMRIAVIGSGISGLGAALALQGNHDVQVFEKADRAGGHANTAEIAYPMPDGSTRDVRVDTGFIVYNEKTYPNLVALFDHLGVETEWSDMSLGFSIDGGRIEWAGDNLNVIFGQRRNLFRPSFIRMARQVLRFNREAMESLRDDTASGTIAEWLGQRGFSEDFKHHYLYPMAGAIWSTRSMDIPGFPARALFSFYENHELFAGLGGAVQWRTVTGGSRSYIERAVSALGSAIHMRSEVVALEHLSRGVRLRFADGGSADFDQAVLAIHSDEALALTPDPVAKAVLRNIQYAPNRTYLHRDPSLMPRRRRVWSSWNAITGGDAEREGASVTYWMNRLQNIDRSMPLFVSLNPAVPPDPALTFLTVDYAHPQFDAAAMQAQTQLDQMQGKGGIWYAGAWLGYGFHEDGLRSGLRVADALGSRPVWARDIGASLRQPARIAAE